MRCTEKMEERLVGLKLTGYLYLLLALCILVDCAQSTNHDDVNKK